MSTFITDEKYGRIEVRDELFANAGLSIGDAGESAIFFARQLEHIKVNALETKYAELPFRKVIPVSNEAGEGADSITQVVYDKTGMAEIIGAYSKDLPRADVGGKEYTVKVREGGISFGFTVMEIAKAQRAGVSLQSRKLQAAIRADEELQNDVAFFGDDRYGLTGLFSETNIPETAVGTSWSTATVDEILDDLFNITDDINTDTKLIESPNKLYMAPSKRKLIARRRLGSVNDTSILEYFVEKSEYINSVDDVVSLIECTAAVRNSKGLSNEDVMIAGDFTPANITYEEPTALKFLPEQRQGLEILIPGYSSFAGVMVNYPLAFSVYTGLQKNL